MAEAEIHHSLRDVVHFPFPSLFFSLEDLRAGYVAIHVAVALYMFVFIAVICHHYFVPSLERLAVDLGIEQSVAGAALLAGGGAIPQLGITLISVFVEHSNDGLDAIVGSALFNNFFVIGISGIFAGQTLHLAYYPVLRDCMANLLTSLLIIVAMIDNYISWYDSVVLLLAYVIYIVILSFNTSLQAKTERVGIRWEKWKEENCPCCANGCHTPEKTSDMGKGGEVDKEVDETSPLKEALAEENKGEYQYPVCPPKGCASRIFWVLFYPVFAFTFLFIPDARMPCCAGCRYMYLLTAFVSLIWIGGCTYILMWMMSVIALTFAISPVITSLTILAIGSTVPDLCVSVIVARQGLGEMAVCNALGSNVVEVLLCLGIPWFIQTVIVDPGSSVYMDGDPGLVISTLAISCVAIYLVFLIGRWRITFMTGVILCLGYVLSISICIWYFTQFIEEDSTINYNNITQIVIV